MLTGKVGVGTGTESGDVPTLLGLVVEVKDRRWWVGKAHWTEFRRSATTHKGRQGHAVPPVARWCKVHVCGRGVGRRDGGEARGRCTKGRIAPGTETQEELGLETRFRH